MFQSIFCEFLFSLTKTLSKTSKSKVEKNFPVNLSPDKPETGFLFFRVVGEILFFLFSFFFSHCLNALSARKSKKPVETIRIFFSLRKPLSAGKPGKSDKSGFTNSVFSGHSSKAEKSIFFLRKSARNCPTAKVVRSRKSVKSKLSVYVNENGQFLKDFSIQICLFFPFQLCPLTTEAMGIWRFAGAFAVVERQGECGSKTC